MCLLYFKLFEQKEVLQSCKIHKTHMCNITGFIAVLQTLCPSQTLNNKIMAILVTTFVEVKEYIGNLWGNVTENSL